MRLIDANKMPADEAEAFASAQAKIEDTVNWLINDVVHKKVKMLINATPTVDAVPVVRCKDCKHWGYGVPGDGEEMRVCIENAEVDMPCDGFCHKGERRMNRAYEKC